MRCQNLDGPFEPRPRPTRRADSSWVRIAICLCSSCNPCYFFRLKIASAWSRCSRSVILVIQANKPTLDHLDHGSARACISANLNNAPLLARVSASVSSVYHNMNKGCAEWYRISRTKSTSSNLSSGSTKENNDHDRAGAYSAGHQ